MTESHSDDVWYDDAAGPVVRPYAMTRGRTRPTSGQLDVISLVVARPRPAPLPAGLSPEQVGIVERCRRPLSVAEVAADMNLPLGTVRVLLDDLLATGVMEAYQPLDLADSPGDDLLEAVLSGLRAL
ncbi:DUF742 domain-containing protein [Micromonospora sonneratiae]|uniref:DUF742 domain-containing protein n=1 Tax=Micromonospora sonneratiae TaxID=1184706 RepID=A0ABW3YNN0_9ACTN